jgi:hypothetical protein
MRKRSPSQSEMLKGTLDMMILRTLVGGDAHGHTIAVEIAPIGKLSPHYPRKRSNVRMGHHPEPAKCTSHSGDECVARLPQS